MPSSTLKNSPAYLHPVKSFIHVNLRILPYGLEIFSFLLFLFYTKEQIVKLLLSFQKRRKEEAATKFWRTNDEKSNFELLVAILVSVNAEKIYFQIM